MKKKFALLLAFIALGTIGLNSVSYAGGMPTVPRWGAIFQENGMATDTGTSTLGIGQGIFGDLITWVGALIGFIIAGILLVALRRAILGGIKRVFVSRRRGRR